MPMELYAPLLAVRFLHIEFAIKQQTYRFGKDIDFPADGL